MKVKLLGLAATFAWLVGMASAAVANSITYTVLDQAFIAQSQCSFFPACPITGGASLTGTITTNGTIGVGLSPSIITGWNFLLNDGTNPVVNLTSANSSITYNFSDLLSATPSDLAFNFAAQPFQELMEFTSSSNGAVLVEMFSATAVPFGAQAQPGGVGFWNGLCSGIETCNQPDIGLLLAYQPEMIQTIAGSGSESFAPVPTPIAGAGLPGFVTVLFGGGLLRGWRRRKKSGTAGLAAP
jgi:hypothetical protein